MTPSSSHGFCTARHPGFFSAGFKHGGVNALRGVHVAKLSPTAACHCQVCSGRIAHGTRQSMHCKHVVTGGVRGKGPCVFSALGPSGRGVRFTMMGSVRRSIGHCRGLFRTISSTSLSFVLLGKSVMGGVSSIRRVCHKFVGASSRLFTGDLPFCVIQNGRRAQKGYSRRCVGLFPSPARRPCCSFACNPVCFVMLSKKRSGPSSSVRCGSLTSFSGCQARRMR